MTTHGWSRFLATRVTGTMVVLLVLSIGVFGLLYLAPGSIERTLLGTKPVTAESLAAVRAQYHLDDSLVSQYLRWLGAAVRGDFGISIRTGESTSDMIGSRLPRTAVLVVMSVVLAILIGVPSGVASALKKGRALDNSISIVAVAGISAPPFALGLVLLLLFSVQLPWFPSYGIGSGWADGIWHLVLPAVTLAVGGAGLIARFTRTALVAQLDQDYVTFARARGLSAHATRRYALRNSLVPVLTAVGLVVTSTLVGTVLVEVTFAVPGLGTLLVDSVSFKDIPVVQAIVLLMAVLIAITNVAVDIAYAVADPRVKLGNVS